MEVPTTPLLTRSVALGEKTVCAVGAVLCVAIFVAGTAICPLLLVTALSAFGSDDPMVRDLAPRLVGLAGAAALFMVGIWLLGHAFLEALWPDRVSPLGRS